jgi:hypothetical protein
VRSEASPYIRMQWRRGVDLVLSVYGRGGLALTLQEPSKFIFLPLKPVHSLQEISKSPYYLHSATPFNWHSSTCRPTTVPTLISSLREVELLPVSVSRACFPSLCRGVAELEVILDKRY